MMAHRGGGVGGLGEGQQHHQLQRVIGNYIVTQQIGAGSFAVVWKARHKSDGNVVAIKEIATDKLNPKLQDSLLSEIEILKKTRHPNIIHLYEVIKGPHRIFLILEYCVGGDLAAYLQEHGGRVSESVARHFMRQLGDGLQVLRANNLIHRDLKPQNLLLSTKDLNAVLKIADFGFARSLQPQGMAETICGSPLYMAPEILHRQKYDAKADLWSVGAILFQLLTGRPPFKGDSHVQLLYNIVQSSEVKFPEAILSELRPDCVDMVRKLLKSKPVERLSFEEFFNHKFMGPSRFRPGHVSESSDSSQDEGLFPFPIEGDPYSPQESHAPVPSKPRLLLNSPPGRLGGGQDGVANRSPPPSRENPSRNKWTDLGSNDDKASAPVPNMSSQGTSPERKQQSSLDIKPGGPYGKEEKLATREAVNSSSPNLSKGMGEESWEGEYVVVPSTESLSPSNTIVGKCSGSPQKYSTSTGAPHTLPPFVGNRGNPASDQVQEALGAKQVLDVPPPDPQTRVSSLKRCARLITELATDTSNGGQVLESFAIHMVCLAIWKESLHVCHTWAAAAAEGNGETFSGGVSETNQETAAASACSLMEREFLVAVDRAEALVSRVEGLDGSTEMHDAMDLIYQAALAVGCRGATEEFSCNMHGAAVLYAKAAALFYFLLVEAPYLPLSPPLVLNSGDRQRVRHYADAVTIRQNECLASQSQKETTPNQQFT